MASRRGFIGYTAEETKSTVNIKILDSTTDEWKDYPVPRLLLVAHAPGFANMVALPNVNAVELRNVSHKTFKIFVDWLWMEYLRIKDTHEDYWLLLSDAPQFNSRAADCEYGDFDTLDPLYWHFDPQSPDTWRHAEVMIDTYLFAKTFGIPRLCEDAQDRLVWCCNMAYDNGSLGHYLPIAVIVRMYADAPPDSSLRRLMVGGWCEFTSDSNKTDDMELDEIPIHFLKAAFKHTIRYGKNGNGGFIGCEFHGHCEGECLSRVSAIDGHDI